jgi:hypothetical protein
VKTERRKKLNKTKSCFFCFCFLLFSLLLSCACVVAPSSVSSICVDAVLSGVQQRVQRGEKLSPVIKKKFLDSSDEKLKSARHFRHVELSALRQTNAKHVKTSARHSRRHRDPEQQRQTLSFVERRRSGSEDGRRGQRCASGRLRENSELVGRAQKEADDRKSRFIEIKMFWRPQSTDPDKTSDL